MTLHAPDMWLWNASLVLQGGALYPGDAEPSRLILNPRHFKIGLTDKWATTYAIRDSPLDFCMIIAGEHLQNKKFNIWRWYSKMLIRAYQHLEGEVFQLSSDNEYNVGCLYDGPMPAELADDVYKVDLVCRWTAGLQNSRFQSSEEHIQFLELNGCNVALR